MVDNAARMGEVMRAGMQDLKERHPSVRAYRQIGLFGMVDLQKDTDGTPMAPYNGSHPAMDALNAFLRDNGLFTFMRWGSFMCNPPLCITEPQLREALSIIDRGLVLTDRVVTG
jgi:taurine--2-oxoglutarate transaminase